MIVTRLAALMATVILAVLTMATPAFAHARVISTSPGAGSTVTGDVTHIMVLFDESVTLLPNAMHITTDRGVPVLTDAPQILGGKTLSAVVQDRLAPGGYVVAWRIMSDDGHIESSTFNFTVAGLAGGQQAGAPSPAAPPPSPGEPLWPVLVAMGIALGAGLGAGLAVRRGLRIVALGSPYPGRSSEEMLRLPM